MNVTDIAVRRGMTAGEKRAAARRDLAADPALTGAELARRYDMTGGWGRARRRAYENETGGTDAARDSTPPAESVTPPVTAPVTRHDPEPEPVTPTVPRHTSGVAHTVKVAGVVVVAAVAAVISYTHMRHLALAAGEGWRADILPLSVDGMMAVASMTALERRRAGKKAGALALTALVLGVFASLAANIVSVDPTLVDQRVVQRVIAAWPPLALVLAFELLLEQGREDR